MAVGGEFGVELGWLKAMRSEMYPKPAETTYFQAKFGFSALSRVGLTFFSVTILRDELFNDQCDL